MDMRKPLIVANWKLNNTIPEALKFAAVITADLKAAGSVDVVIAAPFTCLYSLSVALAETDFQLGAQNIFWEDSGAFTGEVSGPLLKDVGCNYVIIGHSERRQLFGETNEAVHRRIQAALKHDLIPIVCVGETLKEREANRTWEVVETQLREGLGSIDPGETEGFALAYEPVWAIGTGRTATPEQAEEVHDLIRKLLDTAYGGDAREKTRILYGGSVKPSNSRELLAKPNIDGALVGGASLNTAHFAAIVRSAH